MTALCDASFGANQRHRLVSYIDDHLIALNNQLDTATFDRVLQLMHQRVMHTFYNTITNEIEVRYDTIQQYDTAVSFQIGLFFQLLNERKMCRPQKKKVPSIFRQWEDTLNTINECFYGPDPVDPETADGMIVKIQSLLKMHGAESSYLILQYQLERMRDAQQESGPPRLGSVTVRALFVDDQLIVDVLNGRNLQPMDVGGSADPYVKIQLMPDDKFPNAELFKTKVHKNTLYPLFDETFTR